MSTERCFYCQQEVNVGAPVFTLTDEDGMRWLTHEACARQHCWSATDDPWPVAQPYDGARVAQ